MSSSSVVNDLQGTLAAHNINDNILRLWGGGEGEVGRWGGGGGEVGRGRSKIL